MFIFFAKVTIGCNPFLNFKNILQKVFWPDFYEALDRKQKDLPVKLKLILFF